MFSRTKDNGDKSAAGTAPLPTKRSSVRTAPSIISSDLIVKGDLVASGDIQIDGTVEGDVRSASLTVGEKASITGEVLAEDIVIRGRVVGSIRGRRVQLASTCHVEGDILHEALSVETGAFFEGNCRHSDDPLGQSASAKSAVRNPGAPGVPGVGSPLSATRPKTDSDSPVVVKDGGVVIKRPAAQ